MSIFIYMYCKKIMEILRTDFKCSIHIEFVVITHKLNVGVSSKYCCFGSSFDDFILQKIYNTWLVRRPPIINGRLIIQLVIGDFFDYPCSSIVHSRYIFRTRLNLPNPYFSTTKRRIQPRFSSGTCLSQMFYSLFKK